MGVIKYFVVPDEIGADPVLYRTIQVEGLPFDIDKVCISERAANYMIDEVDVLPPPPQ